MVKIVMCSGTAFYRNDTWQAFRAYINSANARGAAVITAYKEIALSTPVQIQLQNVEYFEPTDPTKNPIS